MPSHFRPRVYLLFALLLLAVMLLCICMGSVAIPLSDTLTALVCALFRKPVPEGIARAIILGVRLPRVLLGGLMGAALSLSGAAMQGLLRNPLADGSTLGVSSGASLGAVIALAFGASLPVFSFGGVVAMAMLFALLSMLLIFSLAFALDKSLATNSIILIGVIFSMFASSLMSLIIAFAGERVKTITFWTMGSLSGAKLPQCALLFAALVLCGGVILLHARELNAFAIGEDNARSVGVRVRRVKVLVMLAVCGLVGVCVALGGSIAFVGLVVPHITRLVAGPNHAKLLPASAVFGAVFLMLADLLARTLLSPVELPVGVVTSMAGSVVFVVVFYRARKAG